MIVQLFDTATLRNILVALLLLVGTGESLEAMTCSDLFSLSGESLLTELDLRHGRINPFPYRIIREARSADAAGAVEGARSSLMSALSTDGGLSVIKERGRLAVYSVATRKILGTIALEEGQGANVHAVAITNAGLVIVANSAGSLSTYVPGRSLPVAAAEIATAPTAKGGKMIALRYDERTGAVTTVQESADQTVVTRVWIQVE